jgi:hypothetical protein
MLTKQEFKFNNQSITLARGDDGIHTIAVTTDYSEPVTQVIELNPVAMRKLVRVLKDSPFIFSECNRDDK